MRILLAGLVACLALAGCEARDSQILAAPMPRIQQLDLGRVCGSVKTYTVQELQALAIAIQALPDDSPIIPAIGDYKRMREEARACAAASVPRP